MNRKIDIIRALAWFYALNFVGIFAISHWPGLTDADGRLLGLFHIDPIDDIFHLLSGLIAAGVAMHSRKASVWYFKLAGIPYGIDAFTGLFLGREFLNGNVFTQGIGSPDVSTESLLINMPHIIILVTMLWIGFHLDRKLSASEPSAA